MSTSNQEYNELLYLINADADRRMFPVEIGADGYPILEDGKNYFYAEDYKYVKFEGNADDLKIKWPSSANVPTFYQQLQVFDDPNEEPVPFEPIYYRINSNEPIYKIDLNTRKIEAPQFLSVLEDNSAEVLWFSVDRFYDDVDLFGTTCWVQYKNALGETYISVLNPQIIANYDHNILFIPWPISAAATRAPGNISFSFQFFKISEDQQRVYYSINTQVVTSKVLDTLHVNPLGDVSDGTNFYPEYSELEKTFRWMISEINRLDNDYELYWLEV